MIELGKEAEGSPDEGAIVERILAAVMEQQLPPGTKLGEASLGKTFGVGRMRIRRALLLLANQGVVELHANRGAFIASPDHDEARDVFEARRSIEPSVVRLAVARAKPHDLAAIETHLNKESAAHRAGNRREAIRLSGEFHVRLAEITGNVVMCRMVRELVARTSLIIGLFGASGLKNCREEEHVGILEAIKGQDSELAVKRARAHLDHIEAALDLSSQQNERIDLESILQG